MTSASSVGPAPRAVGLPAVAAAALCVFLIVLTFLAWNLKIGHDPALSTYVPPAQHLVASGKSHPAPAKTSPVSAPVTRSSGGG
jgi:hypothetical protein